MLNALRRSASSWVIRFLFVILILSFGVWGVADYITRWSSERPAITVGDITISMDTVQEEFNLDVKRLRTVLGQTLTTEDARQMGLMRRTVQRLVASATFEMAARTYGLVVPNELLIATVSSQQEFHDANGNFDPALFRRIIATHGFSEESYFQDLRRRLLYVQIGGSLVDGVAIPTILVDHLYRYSHERRVVEIATIPITTISSPSFPDQETLEAFYKENIATFTAPEYRTLSAILLTASTIAPLVSITEEAVREAYNDSLLTWRTPETRTIEQVLSDSREQAEVMLRRVREGQSLAKAANDVMHRMIRLGRLSRAEVGQTDPSLAEAIFTAAPNTVIGPLQSAFGWHLFQVTAITAEEIKPFEEVYDQIREKLFTEKIGDTIYETSSKIESALNKGASIEEAAREVGLTVNTFAPIDSSGTGIDGKVISDLLSMREFLLTAFILTPGTQSAMVESENGFFTVRVDAAAPSRLKPIDEVRQELVKQWITAQRREVARSQAEALAKHLRTGISIHKATEASTSTEVTSKTFLRTDKYDNMPHTLINNLFILAIGEVTVEEMPETFIVARLREVLPSVVDTAIYDELKQKVTDQYAEDILTQLTTAMGRIFNVTVDPQLLALSVRG